MSPEIVIAPDNRKEARFERAPEGERFVDLQHALFTKHLTHRPHSLCDKDLADEIPPFLDALERNLDAFTGAVKRIEKDADELKPDVIAWRLGSVIVEPIEQLQRVTSKKMGEMDEALRVAQERVLVSVSRPAAKDEIAALREDLALQELRAELRSMSKSSMLAAVTRRALEANDLRPLWALDSAVFDVVPREELDDLRRRIAGELSGWRVDLVEFRELARRAVLELISATWTVVSSTLARLRDRYNLRTALASIHQFAGLEPLPPAGALRVFSPQRPQAKQRSAVA